MHLSAMKYGKAFFEIYCSGNFNDKTVVDVGAQDVNGSLRKFCPAGAKYIGVDFAEGRGVDIILSDPYLLPFDNDSVDVVVCSSVFEHSEFFWLLFLECIRILKPQGLLYINAPSNGKVHRYPIDGWRFYPDAGQALVNWARHNSYKPLLLESFIGNKIGLIHEDGLWNDFVSVIIKDQDLEHIYPVRIQDSDEDLFCKYSSNREYSFDLDILTPDLSLIQKNQDSIEGLNHLLVERNAQIDSLHHSVAERNAQIESLNHSVAERDAQIASLNQSVANRDVQISGLAQVITESEGKIKSLIEILSNILGSRSWKITTPLRKINKLFTLAYKAVKIVPKTVGAQGGISALLLALKRIYLSEGFTGISQRTLSRLGLEINPFKTPKSTSIDKKVLVQKVIPVVDIDPGRESYAKYVRPKPIAPKVKLIAFYLPQFHPFKENDEWWGKGFTEWSNVGKALPNYQGHYQPHCPIHFGYYDLRVPSVMEEQAQLAKEFGVHGFSYYFYWFGGKVLMEEPLRTMLANRNVDMPFCLTWANENWSRRWDGQENDVLIAQQHSTKDSLEFIDYLLQYFRDHRYIKINGCPILIIYRASLIPNLLEIQAMWRKRLVENGFPGLYLIAAQTFGIKDPEDFGFDAAVEFPPHTIISSDVSSTVTKTNPDFIGHIYSYDQVVQNAVANREPDYKLFRTTMLSWDNSARKQNNSHIFHGFSIRRYMQWLSSVVNKVYRSDKYSDDERIVFINAWNEWAEGTHLEPDRRYGFAYLKATYDVIRNYVLDRPPIDKQLSSRPQANVAVIVHLHYVETWPEIISAINNGFGKDEFDLYVTTTSIEGISVVRKDFPSAYIDLVENRGRDVLPLINLLDNIINKEYLCAVKIHSKRSIYREDGEFIRGELFEKLLTDPRVTGMLVDKFKSDKNLGMLVPRKYLLQHNDHNMTFDSEIVIFLSKLLCLDFQRDIFPAGSMFWFRPKALLPLLKLRDTDAFEPESGLADGTTAHGVERLFCTIAKSEGFKIDVC